MQIIGCGLFTVNHWPEPEIAAAKYFYAPIDGSNQFGAAEAAFKTAVELEQQCQADCVDYYYLAATHCWPFIACSDCTAEVNPRVLDIYHSSLTKLLSAGTRFGRLDPGSGLQVRVADCPVHVPIRYNGFVWRPEDFDEIEPAGKYCASDLKHIYRCNGLGISALVTHCRRSGEQYRNPIQRFGCTVLLRPDDSAVHSGVFSLEFHDPLRVDRTKIGGKAYAITRDTSAPFAYALANNDKGYLKKFFYPGSSDDTDGLIMLEPYQPEKIPLIFVHGLLSDRLTWATLANDIVACPELFNRYQLWAYEYATSEPFLASAAVLRRQLSEIQTKYDNQGQNIALNRTVLIGHSMGGLVSKLMVTESSDCLWQTVSNRPFDSIRVDEETRSRLARSFFFQPQSMVKRVVYIGTPHKGSPLARGPINPILTSLVEVPEATRQMHQNLITSNPGSFSAEFSRRIPTSGDLLRPDSPLLQAIDGLPVSMHVKQHSIIGTGIPTLGAFSSDGVVPAWSSTRNNVETHLEVHSKHVQLHKQESVVAEVIAILRRHLSN